MFIVRCFLFLFCPVNKVQAEDAEHNTSRKLSPCGLGLTSPSGDEKYQNIQNAQYEEENTESFHNPVCLLILLNINEFYILLLAEKDNRQSNKRTEEETKYKAPAETDLAVLAEQGNQ